MTDPRGPQGGPAGPGADDPFGLEPGDVDRVGTRLVTGLHAIDKALRVYEVNNRAVIQILEDLAEAIREAPGQDGRGPCLEVRDEHFLLNGVPVRLGYKIWQRSRELGTALRRRGIRGFCLPPEPTRQKLQLLFARLQKLKLASAPEAEGLLSQITTETGAVVLTAPPLTSSAEQRDRDRDAVRLYAILAVLISDVLEAARAGKRITLVPLKRVIQLVADQLDQREGLLLSLPNLPGYRGHLETHLANVTLLALAVGRRLHLAPECLMELALAAAIHDLPAALLPRELQARVERGEELSPAEQGSVSFAPRQALLYVLQGPGTSSSQIMAQAVTLAEASAEFTAPPRYQSGVGPSVLSRLLAIVNAYELLVRPVGGWDPLLPSEAMRWLLVDHAERFDPLLLSAFGRVLGLFPTGSLVELTSGQIAVVVGQQREEGLVGAPIVEVVTSDDGEPIQPERVDLANDGRAIRSPLEPSALGFDPLQHFLRA